MATKTVKAKVYTNKTTGQRSVMIPEKDIKSGYKLDESKDEIDVRVPIVKD